MLVRGCLMDNGSLVFTDKTTYIGSRYHAFAGYDAHRQHTLILELYETDNIR